MRLKLRKGTNARTIAELHRRIVIACHAVDEILNDQRFDDYPLCAASMDAVITMVRQIAEAGNSLETPILKLLGNDAPLSCMNYPPEHWAEIVEKFEAPTKNRTD